MIIPPLHVLCAELGLIAYAPGFLSTPGSVLMSGLLALKGRTMHAFIMGKDPVVGPVPFGFVTDGPEGIIVTIRGTQMPDGTLFEWLDDFDAVLEDCPWAKGCRWHRGFGRVYETLNVQGTPLPEYLRTLRGLNPAPVVITVHGHSLGGPLATYAAGEAGLDAPVLFASPKPGDSALRVWLRARWLPTLTDQPRSYANPNDVVPKVPVTVDWPLRVEDFQHVFDLDELLAGSVAPPVPSSWAQSHSLGNYLRLLGGTN